MSRPSVFRRIASWLKNTAKLNKDRREVEEQQRVRRTYSVQTLEDRHMLDGAFFYDAAGDSLTLDSFTEIFGEGLTISETASDYRFQLAEGVWTGIDNAAMGITGNGTGDLRVDKFPFPFAYDVNTITINDTIGLDYIFDGIDVTGIAPVTDFNINTNRGDITQTALSSVGFFNFNVDGANLIDLREISNQFGLIRITDTNDVQIRDSAGMNLDRIQINNDAEFENNGLMVLQEPMDIGGNLLLNSNFGDIYQQRDAAVFVQGETFLKSNFADEFGIDFGFGDRNGDGINDNDFVGPVNVLQGAQIEIVDSNSLIVGDVNTHGNNIRDVFQFYGEAENGSITIDGIVRVQGTDDADGKVILRSTNGGTATSQGFIVADDLAIIGEGDYVFDTANDLFDDNAGRPGSIAGDVTGNLLYHNERDLQVAAVNFEFIADRDPLGAPQPVVTVNVNALEVRQMPDGSDGNLTITTSNDNLTQSGSAPVIVETLTTIDVGTGNVIWEFGDELGNLLNDNNWNRLTVLNANNASFVDEGWLIIGDVNATNNARFQAENDNALFADGEIIVGNNVLFQSDIGVTQMSGFVEAAGLMAQGSGDFIFDLSNRLGSGGVGNVAAELRAGEFVVDNIFGIQVTTLAAFGENIVGIDGFQVDKTRLRGSEIQVNQVINVLDTFLESETTITQTAAVTGDSLMLRSNGDATLGTANNVTTLAAEIEGNFNYSSDIEFWIGQLTYDGTTISGASVENGVDNNFTITTTDDDVHQFLDGPVVVEGELNINIGLGCLDFVFGDGDADTVNDNDFGVIVINSAQRVEIVSRNDMTTNAINVSDQIRLQSEIGTIHLVGDLVATNKVLLQAGNGVQQDPDDMGIEGIINTAALMLSGDGAFVLDHQNEVGDAVNKGELAVEINGTFDFTNIFELTSKTLDFDLKDGSTFTINGFMINTGGDALILNVFGLTIETEIMAPKIIINTQGDIIQGAAGRFITDELVLNGVGNFELTANNQIGTAGTPGVVAINVEGNVELVNDFAIDFGLIVCGTDTFQGATLMPGAFADGDLILTTAGQDITQSDDSSFAVFGTTTFDVGVGNVNLPGSVLGPNDFNAIQVASAAIVEIVDANRIIIESSAVSDKMMIKSGDLVPSQIILDDNIIVTNQLMLDAGLGVSQQRGFVITDTLLLNGNNDFDMRLDNEVNRLGAEIIGNLDLHNDVDLMIVKDDYTDLGGSTTSFAGVDLDPAFFDGNLNITTTNDNVSQAADAHVKVAEAASFDLGVGELDLTFGDSNADLINDNDLNVLAIASAQNAEVSDQNSISVDNTNVANNLFVQSEGGSISIQGEVSADARIMLAAESGAGTRIGALLDTDELLVTGKGEFNLNGDNRIGAAVTPGSVGVDVQGNVILHNDFGIHFDNVSFTQLDGTVHNLAGANVDVNGFAGNLFVAADGGITDDDTVDILVDGSAAFVAGPGTDVDLGGANMVMASSVGLGGQNVSLILDNELVLDGVQVEGDLSVQSKGGISQSAIDVSGLAGSRFVNVNGLATFVVDSVSGLVEQLNVNLLSNGTSLMNNRFAGHVVIEGTSMGGGFGELGSVQIRNSIVDTALFPTINRVGGDQLTSLSVWAPNSSLSIRDLGGGADYDVMNNMTVFAGVDSETGLLGGNLKVTDNTKTRSLRDDAGVSITVGGNLNTNAANTLILADNAADSIVVGDTLSLVNQGGANENRIRIGVGTGGTRGDDSGAVVNTDKLRTRANRNGTDGHVTVNIDGDIVFTNSNFATSLVAVADGNITDEATSSVSVANAAFFDANGGAGDITLGDDNATNRTIFGSVGFLGNNVSFTEDTSALLNGSDIGGTFDAFAKGGIRQSGLDRQGRAGTGALEVDGDSTFTVDGNVIPTNHLADSAGRDVLLMNDNNQNLIDNIFGGSITIQSTQQLSGGNGSVRTVAIRNTAMNAATPMFNVDATDQLKHLTIWHTNSSVNLNSDLDIAGNLTVIAGLDSDNGKVAGNKSIVNDTVIRDIFDANNVNISVARNASFYAANHINLVNNASNSLLVGRTATFVSKGGAQGNQVDVGTSGARGNDSGGTFETSRLKFTIENTGVGGNLTIVADQAFTLDPTSSAPSVFLTP